MNQTSGTDLLCGPLLRYTYVDHAKQVPEWHGSILVVLQGHWRPALTIETDRAVTICADPTLLFREVDETRDVDCTFWRFSITVPLKDADHEVSYVIRIPGYPQSLKHTFWVPGKDDSMHLMFYTCNAYSLAAKGPIRDAGPILWKDVLRLHQERPIHVMIGGGDQIYCDAVCTEGPLKDWAPALKPKDRSRRPITEDFEKDLMSWYFKHYCKQFGQEPYRTAAASIPSINIIDDHDIIDGYGSYRDSLMRTPLMLVLGRVAWKYYLLFQNHTLPEGEEHEDPTWVIGRENGPYVNLRSRSICTNFGKRVVFFGLDTRSERSINRVCYESTYDEMFARLQRDIVKGKTKHLILMLAIPIVYPRLVCLEDLCNSKLMSIPTFFCKLFNIAPGLFNVYDGSIEILDDLNDHWCSRKHKRERQQLIIRLQELARTKQVRVTILSGDVHLASVGRLFSKASLNIPQNRDFRYMPNVISSAITNTPPSLRIANFLNWLNKLHHFDRYTRENQMPIFFKSPSGARNANHAMLPTRNFCTITEYVRVSNASSHSLEGYVKGPMDQGMVQNTEKLPREDMIPAYYEKGVAEDVASDKLGTGPEHEYALDVAIRAEIDPKDPSGRTYAYYFRIPCLEGLQE